MRIAAWNVRTLCVRTDINNCKITNWTERSKNRTDWEKSTEEEKVRIGL